MGTGSAPTHEIYSSIDDQKQKRWPEGASSHPQRNGLFFGFEDEKPPPPEIAGAVQKIKRHMQGMSKFQFSPAAIRTGADQYDGSGRQPFLKTNGSNLAEVLQYLQEEERGSMKQLKDLVIEYAKGGNRFVDIGVATYDEKAYLSFYEEGKNRKTYEIRGALLADGYWVFTAFACLASCSLIPTWAFFEEPESYLHPHKLGLLHQIFQKLHDRDQENPSQILLSSHSPYLLDTFKEYADSVFFLKDGQAIPLSSIKNYEEILSLHSLGEAWYSNIFDLGNP